jgi:hypothetical protein
MQSAQVGASGQDSMNWPTLPSTSGSRPADLATQDRHLVPKDQQLRGPGVLVAGQRRQPAEHCTDTRYSNRTNTNPIITHPDTDPARTPCDDFWHGTGFFSWDGTVAPW